MEALDLLHAEKDETLSKFIECKALGEKETSKKLKALL